MKYAGEETEVLFEAACTIMQLTALVKRIASPLSVRCVMQ